MSKAQSTAMFALAFIALSNPSFAQPETTAPAVPRTATGTPQQRSPANMATASPIAFTTSNADSNTAAAPVEDAIASRWMRRGWAMRCGASVSVFCDYQGNVGAS